MNKQLYITGSQERKSLRELGGIQSCGRGATPQGGNQTRGTRLNCVFVCVYELYGTEVSQAASTGPEDAGHHEGHQLSPLCSQPCCQAETLLNALCDRTRLSKLFKIDTDTTQDKTSYWQTK